MSRPVGGQSGVKNDLLFHLPNYVELGILVIHFLLRHQNFDSPDAGSIQRLKVPKKMAASVLALVSGNSYASPLL